MARDKLVVCEDFAASRVPVGLHWYTSALGTGALEPTGSTLCFVNTDTTPRQISNAQVDDYQGLRRRQFLWHPPLRMTVCARFSHPAGQLSGTAGFGFWNDPFMMTGKRWPSLPRATWFFYASPPSNMRLDLKVPGYGWKAATLDAIRLPFFLLAPTAPVAIPLMNVRPLYRALWPIGQRAIGVSEAQVEADMREWHTYCMEWRTDSVHFQVDEHVVLDCETSPKGPLGFVMWLDNQCLVATPWGKLRYRWLASPGRQWMEIDTLSIEETD